MFNIRLILSTWSIYYRMPLSLWDFICLRCYIILLFSLQNLVLQQGNLTECYLDLYLACVYYNNVFDLLDIGAILIHFRTEESIPHTMNCWKIFSKMPQYLRQYQLNFFKTLVTVELSLMVGVHDPRKGLRHNLLTAQLSAISKALEKSINSEIPSYLELHKLMYDTQCGFRKQPWTTNLSIYNVH